MSGTNSTAELVPDTALPLRNSLFHLFWAFFLGPAGGRPDCSAHCRQRAPISRTRSGCSLAKFRVSPPSVSRSYNSHGGALPAVTNFHFPDRTAQFFGAFQKEFLMPAAVLAPKRGDERLPVQSERLTAGEGGRVARSRHVQTGGHHVHDVADAVGHQAALR